MRSLRLRWAWVGLLLLCLAACVKEPPPLEEGLPPEPVRSGRWVLIDTKEKTLAIFDGAEKVKLFKPVALGIAGAGIKRRRGDEITPLGEFRITDIRPSRRFDIFIELNYPTLEYAERGLAGALINQATYNRIAAAQQAGRRPPQDTVLGGWIGIHGVGRGDIAIHRLINWTAGCAALDNRQIRELAGMLKRGIVVEIR